MRRITLQTLIWKSDKNTKVQNCVLNGFSEWGKELQFHEALQTATNQFEMIRALW